LFSSFHIFNYSHYNTTTLHHNIYIYIHTLAHHNRFGKKLQRDTLHNFQLTNQLIELRRVVDNPCEAYVTKKSTKVTRTQEEKSQGISALPSQTVDDGFCKVAEGKEAIQDYVRNTPWLKKLAKSLHMYEFDDFVGQTFQQNLAHRYLRKCGMYS